MMMFGGYDFQNIYNIDIKYVKLVDDVELFMKIEKGVLGYIYKFRGERVMGGWGGCFKNEIFIDFGGSLILSFLIRDQELIEFVRNGRLIRLVMKRESGILNVTFVRVIRLRVYERNGNLGDEVKEVLSDKFTRVIRLVLIVKKVESGILNIEFNGKIFDEKVKVRIFISIIRVIRSTVCEGIGILDVKVKELLEDIDFVQLEYVQKSDFEFGFEVLRKKKVCVVVYAELKLAESNKKLKRLSYVERK